jgi:hypothetical protein
MLTGVSQVEAGSDRNRHFESGLEWSKYLSPAAAMQKSSRAGTDGQRRALISIDLVELHVACQSEI